MKKKSLIASLYIIIFCLTPNILFSQNNRLWATYYGASQDEYGNATVTDASGHIYITGSTYSSSGIASGGFQITFGGGQDAYLVKFDASGNRLWATYYGGPGYEEGHGVTVDAAGNVVAPAFTHA